jgi:hypothetical protein
MRSMKLRAISARPEMARHVIRCRATQEMRAQNAYDEVAGNICRALLAGHMVVHTFVAHLMPRPHST